MGIRLLSTAVGGGADGFVGKCAFDETFYLVVYLTGILKIRAESVKLHMYLPARALDGCGWKLHVLNV